AEDLLGAWVVEAPDVLLAVHLDVQVRVGRTGRGGLADRRELDGAAICMLGPRLLRLAGALLGHEAARLRGRRVLDRAEEGEGHHSEYYEDQGGADCPTHLERRVAPDLGRGRSATLVAEIDHRVDEDLLDQQAAR